MMDLISRQKAIDALMDALNDVGVLDAEDINTVFQMLPSAQPTPDQNGDLWITVPDIDKVTRIYVQESKSKFCRIFYEEQEQPERIKGRWIHDGHHIRCDQCREYMCDKDAEGDRIPTNFCPNCGADMTGEQDD